MATKFPSSTPGTPGRPAAHPTLADGDPDAGCRLILAHGAGLPMDSPFMANLAAAIAASTEGERIQVFRFEFPYMAGRRLDGKRRGPDRPAVLLETWATIIDQLRPPSDGPPVKLLIGGKSMGGRIATMVADESSVDGVVVLGYPFHPAGKPDRLRTEHLQTLSTPTLICQGERDPLGTRNEVASYRLSSKIEFSWAWDGNHDLRPRKSSGATQESNLVQAVVTIAQFATRLRAAP